MDETLLLKVSIATAIIGILALWIIQATSPIEESSLFEAKQSADRGAVRVSGVVKQARISNNITRIIITREETLDVVIFENVAVEPGTKIKAEGIITDYNGKKELLADSIVS